MSFMACTLESTTATDSIGFTVSGATYLLLYALFGLRDGVIDGPGLKASLEQLPRTYYGVVATYERPFSPEDKDAITAPLLVMGQVRKGAVTFAYPEDARRNLFVQRKR